MVALGAEPVDDATALTRDGVAIHFQTHGKRSRPAIFLGPHFYVCRPAHEPPYTSAWIERLKQDFFLITADYPRGVGRTRSPLGLAYTPDIAVEECERIADAAGVDRFGWLGYSFGGALGVQFACRSPRIAALVVGGFPPLRGPFQLLAEILASEAVLSAAAPRRVDPAILWTAVGFYRSLLSWPEYQAVSRMSLPRLVFMGDRDTAQGLPEPWSVPLADHLKAAEATLRRWKWHIEWLRGHDHATAIQPDVSLSLVHRFFLESLKG